uniref:Uncharacterized protein n=1 Tax=Anguilla anguilla TaxID=7936 RepID=A0A0E9SX61_ANGAN
MFSLNTNGSWLLRVPVWPHVPVPLVLNL